MLALILFIFLALTFPSPLRAQSTPLMYQLISTYHSADINSSSNPSAAITPTPVLPIAMNSPVLGVSSQPLAQISATPTPTNTTLPAIGGEGSVVTVAVLGDSMIDTLGSGIPQLVTALNRLYPTKKFVVLNYGLGSSNLESGLNRLDHDYVNKDQTIPSLFSQNPDIVVVESFAYNNYGNTQAGYDKQWLNLGAIISKINQFLPQAKIVLAATIAPNSVTFANNAPNINYTALEKVERTSTIKLYLQNLISFANSQGFPVADAYHPSLVGNDGNQSYINAADNIHPSTAGGQLFCNSIAKTIGDNGLIEN